MNARERVELMQLLGELELELDGVDALGLGNADSPLEQFELEAEAPRLYSPGRDGPFGPPPGQSPACGFPAPGSHLGSTGSETFVGPWMMDPG